MAVNVKTTAVPDVLIATGRTLGQLNTIVNTAADDIDTLEAASHAAVTLAGEDYLSLSGQEITAAEVNLASNVTGTLPYTSVGGLTHVQETGTSRTNSADDKGRMVEWTSSSPKTFAVENNVAAATNAWVGFNSGSGTLTLAAGSGVTLTGNLIFAQNKGYMVYFTSASAAIVFGGAAS
jgi:hypothetical protein